MCLGVFTEIHITFSVPLLVRNGKTSNNTRCIELLCSRGVLLLGAEVNQAIRPKHQFFFTLFSITGFQRNDVLASSCFCQRTLEKIARRSLLFLLSSGRLKRMFSVQVHTLSLLREQYANAC